MRYIDPSFIQLPEGWSEKAEKAFEEIKDLPPDERIKAISKRSQIWSELKTKLEERSYGKCWYCESREIRSDNPVDHFRPKGRVANCPNHGGYWWLAFDLKNYRFCCTYCNSRRTDQETNTMGGKHDFFPIHFEEKRALVPDNDLDEEDPCLLDPTDEFDPSLLWFEQDGRTISKYKKSENEWFDERANKSIELYHLNHYQTKQKRSLLYDDIMRHVKDGDWFFNRHLANEQGGNTAERRSIKLILRNLRNTIKEDAEFSGAAKAYLLGLRQEGREWLDTLFTN